MKSYDIQAYTAEIQKEKDKPRKQECLDYVIKGRHPVRNTSLALDVGRRKKR